MTTCAALIDETIDLLYGSTRRKLNTLRSSVGASDTTLTFNYALEGINVGSLLAVDLELVHVLATDATASTATVIRGERGSTAATHAADGVVTVNPIFSRWAVFRSLNNDLLDLSAEGLFSPRSAEITYNAAVRGYDLDGVTNIDDIIEIRYQTTGPEKVWPLIPPGQWRLWSDANTTDFPSGFALQLAGGGYPGLPVHVTYRGQFTPFASEATTSTSVGLEDTMVDLPPLGAALRLFYPRESIRDRFEAQPDTRRPDEVPAGANLGVARDWERMRVGRINRERSRQLRRWPLVKR